MHFSVLMTVYSKEKPQHFKIALESLSEQTLLPSELVVVKDGPLGPELEEVLSGYIRTAKFPVRLFNLEKNSGQGIASALGLENCLYDYVARMDSDDFSYPQRFQKQIQLLESSIDLDVVGSWMGEFDQDPLLPSMIRVTPVTHDEIIKKSPYFNPINNISVIFRKKAIESVGGYAPIRNFEDYNLWVRLLATNKKFQNIPEVLVSARISNNMHGRRKGWDYIKGELQHFKIMYDLKLINIFQLIVIVFARIFVRTIFGPWLSSIYRFITPRKKV